MTLSSVTAQTGYLDNLTAEEEAKLQEAWIHILRLCGVEESVKHKTPDRTRELQQHLSDKSAEVFRRRLWSFILADHPDVLVLRFLRARKWDVDKAMAMLVSAVNWRHERRLEEDIVAKGDSVGLAAARSADEESFLAQYRSGKAYVRGADRERRPVFVIKVRLHDPKLQSPEAMEAFILHNIETIRTMIRYPDEKACLIFDLTGFGLKNMDFHVVKFLVQVFEARYPEYLGVVLVHNAPFVFWGVWKIVRPWLDPVIASKINFTNSNADLARFIEQENLQSCYGGKDSWEYSYIEPVAGENERMQSEKKADVEAARAELVRQFEQLSVEWASLEPKSVASVQKVAERRHMAKKLAEAYWDLDPYIRARSYYDRAGVLGATGAVDYKAAQ
ncbi:495bc431-2511-4eb6-a2d8-20647a523157 [Thermothielavioides terrestris]|uniref:495bc431-2511-4eb6-a2d8-20647a523157 n=1 Tax=Thermothielavioides terrestris TaxID=2587410 RepID=A0A446BD37_9PEZI|nr:495bc431-2511-4eb6-a2d8-20647a523157 [Thermothielavioides terrestris]